LLTPATSATSFVHASKRGVRIKLGTRMQNICAELSMKRAIRHANNKADTWWDVGRQITS
jgi:hypothetical protein